MVYAKAPRIGPDQQSAVTIFALTPGGEILTEALIYQLQRQATHDAEPLVRATAASIPRIYGTYTFRELTWALTRSAALGAPNACLRFLGENFDSMLKIALCATAGVYREITSEGGTD